MNFVPSEHGKTEGLEGSAAPMTGGALYELEDLPEQGSLKGRVAAVLVEIAEEIGTQATAGGTEAVEGGRCWRHKVYGAAAIAACLLVAVVTWAYLRLPADTTSSSANRGELDRCKEQARSVMRAITRYTRDRGRPPGSLEELRPDYLVDLPVDPITGVPLAYESHGDVVSLSCRPKHP
jgi:hypothetical protein